MPIQNTNQSTFYLIIAGLTTIIITALVAMGFTIFLTDQADQDREDDFNPVVETKMVDNLELT